MLRKYEMELDELKHPLMVEESSYECPDERLNSPEKIVRLLNECFRLDKKAEEYVYMLAFDAKCNPLGVFELGHGSVNACILNPREIFQRALICGAVNIVIAHNHPSHDTTPSKDDDVAASKISEAGKLMKIQLVDFIIIGNGYFSYAEREYENKKETEISNFDMLFFFFMGRPSPPDLFTSRFALHTLRFVQNLSYKQISCRTPNRRDGHCIYSLSHHVIGNGR